MEPCCRAGLRRELFRIPAVQDLPHTKRLRQRRACRAAALPGLAVIGLLAGSLARRPWDPSSDPSSRHTVTSGREKESRMRCLYHLRTRGVRLLAGSQLFN
jgi:hypothetical protein